MVRRATKAGCTGSIAGGVGEEEEEEEVKAERNESGGLRRQC